MVSATKDSVLSAHVIDPIGDGGPSDMLVSQDGVPDQRHPVLGKATSAEGNAKFGEHHLVVGLDVGLIPVLEDSILNTRGDACDVVFRVEFVFVKEE